MAGKSLKKRGIALALSVILAGGGVGALIPSYEAEAEEAVYGTEAEAPSYEGRPAVHDYGKSGDDPATPEDESELVADSDVKKSAVSGVNKVQAESERDRGFCLQISETGEPGTVLSYGHCKILI